MQQLAAVHAATHAADHAIACGATSAVTHAAPCTATHTVACAATHAATHEAVSALWIKAEPQWLAHQTYKRQLLATGEGYC